MYEVLITKQALKSAMKMPRTEQIKLNTLVSALKATGPVQIHWPNYSMLNRKERRYHCHLSYHWVVCWQELGNHIQIEVYYAGSRENAPY